MVRGTVFPLSNQADEDEVIVFTVHMSLRTACTSCSHRDGRADPVPKTPLISLDGRWTRKQPPSPISLVPQPESGRENHITLSSSSPCDGWTDELSRCQTASLTPVIPHHMCCS
ncbi:hypothetical protein DPX16_13810 [Anabarilius grahami]|uniref:Uncharacterized protein n=1 Tax=Anabarilius grahami TaxID=495550 RepID=A0A3N0XS23_ANAGA|nr:hypothetical protein DPX16_13810 [Anabarilius grahami]